MEPIPKVEEIKNNFYAWLERDKITKIIEEYFSYIVPPIFDSEPREWQPFGDRCSDANAWASSKIGQAKWYESKLLGLLTDSGMTVKQAEGDIADIMRAKRELELLESGSSNRQIWIAGKMKSMPK